MAPRPWARWSPGTVMTATFMAPEGSTGYRCTIHPVWDGEIAAG